jgi:hypothetical protein
MELGIERVTRLISEQTDDLNKFCVVRNYSELWTSHVCSSDRRIAGDDATTTVDPAVGSAGDVDRVESLASEELCSTSTSAAEGTDHIDRPRGGNLRNPFRKSRQRDVEGTCDMAVRIFIVLAYVDENCSRCQQTLKFAEIDFWD